MLSFQSAIRNLKSTMQRPFFSSRGTSVTKNQILLKICILQFPILSSNDSIGDCNFQFRPRPACGGLAGLGLSRSARMALMLTAKHSENERHQKFLNKSSALSKLFSMDISGSDLAFHLCSSGFFCKLDIQFRPKALDAPLTKTLEKLIEVPLGKERELVANGTAILL